MQFGVRAWVEIQCLDSNPIKFLQEYTQLSTEEIGEWELLNPLTESEY